MKAIPISLLFILYILIACIGFIFIPGQVKSLSPLLAVTLRFTLGTLFLLGWGLSWQRHVMRHFNLTAHLLMAVNGFISFFINYIFAYQAFYSLPSGIVAVALSILIVPNLLFERIFLKTELKLNMILGCFVSVVGLILLFIKDIGTLQLQTQEEIFALYLILASTLFTSLGTILLKKLLLKGYAALPILTYSMSWGSVFGVVACLYQGMFSYYASEIFSYWASLMYVGLIVSAVGFLIFFELVDRCGPTKASYVWVIAPLGSLLYSIMFENLSLTLSMFLGVFFILSGAIIFNNGQTSYKISMFKAS